jgi:phospho-N-acetylmuramoyl-pentapeptide-transferase
MLTKALLWLVAVFLVTVPLGGWAVGRLRAWGIAKRIRSDEPDSHQVKWGTPTMGGLYFLAVLTLGCLMLWAAGVRGAWPPLVATLAFAALGAFDDVQGLRDHEGVGWLVRGKFAAQWLLALGVAVVLYLNAPAHFGARAPGAAFGLLDVIWIVLAMLYLVGMANAVNITDGMDGLAGGTCSAAYGALAVIFLAEGQTGWGLFALTVVGALLGYLWHNSHPAAVIMGDTGSQALGAGLAALAALSGRWLLVPLIGLVFVIEALAVMIQVGYFKHTRRRYGEGRRVFRMAPIHYHFELGGWSEVQVTTRFVLVGVAAALVGVALALGGVAW